MVLGVVGLDPAEDTGSAGGNPFFLEAVTPPVPTWITHMEISGVAGGGTSTWRCFLRYDIPSPSSAVYTGKAGGDSNFVDIVNTAVNSPRVRGALPVKVLMPANTAFFVCAMRQDSNASAPFTNLGSPAKLNASSVGSVLHIAALGAGDFANLAGWQGRLAAYADGSSGGVIVGSADDNMVRVMVTWLNTNDPGKNYEKYSITDLERHYYWKKINGAGSAVPSASSTNDLARTFYSQGLSNTYTKSLDDLMIEYMRLNAVGAPAAASLGDLALLYWGGL